MTTTKPLTKAEGYQRGKEDKLGRYAPDVYRHVQAWAENFYVFECGYQQGYTETPYPER